MNSKFVVTKYRDGVAAALFEEGKAAELSFCPGGREHLLGNIYIGKVSRVVKNIQAAFVEIENGISCYLPLSKEETLFFTTPKKKQEVVAGDEILVQVSQEAVKTKGPTVTGNITFTGKYLVLTVGDGQSGVSAKLSKSQKEMLQEQMKELKDPRFGWIVRTEAAHVSFEKVKEEGERLKNQLEELYCAASHRTARSCLYRAKAPWLEQLKSRAVNECQEILTDDEDLFREMEGFLQESGDKALTKLRYYQDRLLPLGKLYSVEGAFEEALRERVWLKSGAYLVIQPTEALTVIDVNTGKCQRGKKAQDTFEKINLEAAREIARQMRLRNLSGIVIVDFINLEEEEKQAELIRQMRALAAQDPVKCHVVDITPLGLMEITRKRTKKSLREQICD